MQIFSKILPAAAAVAFALVSITSSARTVNANVIRAARAHAPEVQTNYEPTSTLNGIRNYGDVDGPDGELWYFTANLISKTVVHPYWTQKILTEYEFTLYDAQMNVVGKIHDKMRYRSNETAVPGPEQGCDFLPVITKHYFNSDDKYEVVVSLAVNTTTEGVNNTRSVVYSLGGEKEMLEVEDVTTGKMVTKEFDKPIAEYDSFIGDVLDVSTPGNEQYYMTFYGDLYDTDKGVCAQDETSDYWQSVISYGTDYHVYGKAGADGRLTDVVNFFIPSICTQGDQQDTPPALTLAHDNKGYIVVPRYVEPFFNPYGPIDDMTMREKNDLSITVYELSGSTAKKIQETLIPVVKMPGDDVLATYYSVGDLRGSKDVNFGDFTQDGRASFYLTRCNYGTTHDSTSDYCYYVYDPDGNKIKTIFENATGSQGITDLDGFESQHMFVSFDETYVYNFVDLKTGYNNKTVAINSYVDAYNTGDEDSEELMLAKVDRVPLGDSYKYVFEMREPLTDETGDNFIRLCWFDSKGKFERVDHVNMGADVDYAQTYISSPVLVPTLFCDDETPEYCVLIKRSHAGTSDLTEELMICQPTNDDLTGGKTLLHLTPSETKGSLSGIGVYNYGGIKRLMISYLDSNKGFNVDLYDLPFRVAAIESITPDSDFENISFDGSVLNADGVISVYTVGGQLVAEGNGTVNVTSLSPGIYVAVNGATAYKFQVK